ncbi:MAG: CHAT domain-containing protein [Chitinophagaceae bacterium]|nr:MAG: CHAT domain-containing protein [Chitinophagaceae bacterium]
MPRHSPLILSVLISVVVLFPLFSQRSAGGAHAIEKALSEGDFKRADSLFTYDVAHFASTGNLDTLITYIPLAGKIGNKDAGPVQAKKKVYELINLLTHHDASGHQLLEAYEDAGEFFGSIGQDQYGYDANKEALEIAMSIPKLSPLRIARCEYNLGTYAQRLGNLGLSQKHGRNAMAIRQHQPDTPPEDMYLSANAMGALMWFGSRYDSAAIFFKQALAELEKATPNDLNRYFRPANVWNNMAAIYSVEGNTTEAIHAMEMTIVNFQKYLEGEDPKAKRVSATEGLFQAIDNLAGIYREIGDYGKGGDLLRYSYQRKLQTFEAGNPGIFISEILLGQHYQGLYEYDSASYYLKAGLEKLEQSEGGYLFWAADAYYNLAMIAENKNDNAQAAIFYKKSEALYEESYQGDYDNIYMGFLRSASVFYAKNNNYPAAIERAEKVYNYLVSIGENASLQAFYQLLNIAEINFLTHRYKEAVHYSNNALSTLRSKMQGGFTMLDSIKMEVFKPKALLINAKSSYFLKTNRDTSFLKSLATQMAEASEILQKRKVFIDDAASINILMKDHQELLDFSKQLQLELFEKSGNPSHLDALVNLHESALYSRIRARLDKQRAIRFTQLPDSIKNDEDSLKSAIAGSLQMDIPKTEQIAGYLAALNRWEAYLATLKTKYPSYYNMRYATLSRPISELQEDLSDSTTLIRYIYCDSRLLALVVDKKHKQLIPLNSDSLDENISKLLTIADEKRQLPLLYDLYRQVWEPIASKINTKRVVIIPDGILYNLSFEMLADASLKNYSELASNSLLSRHSISYHYSLFMLNQPALQQNLRSNYVGFTPGFSDELKEKYIASRITTAGPILETPFGRAFHVKDIDGYKLTFLETKSIGLMSVRNCLAAHLHSVAYSERELRQPNHALLSASCH